MAKKKKTKLNPVARGFATTSVPKKAVPAVETQEDATSSNDEQAQSKSREETQDGQRPGVIVKPQGPNDEFDPDKVEEQSLQNLVNKLQEKTEREISRTIKTIAMDRHFSKTLPHLELDTYLVDQIISLVIGYNIQEPRPLEEPEEKALAKLAITYGVLKRLGFSESRVEDCLRSIRGVDLDEAYEWLYLHCPKEELEGQSPSITMEATPNRETVQVSPSTGSSVQQSQVTPSSADTPGSSLTPSHVSSAPSTPQSKVGEPTKDDYDTIKARIMDMVHAKDDDNSEHDDPTIEYAQLKLEHDTLMKSSRVTKDMKSSLSKLRARLDELKKHYFFDQKEADAIYHTHRKQAESLTLLNRLRSLTGPDSTTNQQEHTIEDKPKVLPSKPSTMSTTVMSDVFDGEESDSSEGVLALFEDRGTATVNGQTITVRDMSLPKHWSGRTPKTLLKDSVLKLDRYAIINYAIVSGSSRAKRASLTIRWEGRKSDEWTMDDIACPDETQAEQYIATIALHNLIFPTMGGSSKIGSSLPGGQTLFRSLPAVFRDLWDELEVSRKANDDLVNRTVWAKLRTIVEPKLDTNKKFNTKALKAPTERETSRFLKSNHYHQGALSDHLASEFQARQSSYMYQEMLAQRNMLPIAQYRQEIIQTLENCQVLVLSGETGCGKSTQVPAFILEDQLSRGQACKIFCTEPRRISAISLAQRVSRELGDPPGTVGSTQSLVGYSIRLESNISRTTRLAYVTNGIALRMLEGSGGEGGHGVAFDEVTHIIVDEVHERTIESDFLLIVLKILLQQRPDLKVILMSATVDADKISTFFGGCPTLHVPGRTFPVEVRYLEDAIEYTGWTVTPGSPYARRHHDKFYKGKNRLDWTEELIGREDEEDEDVVLNPEGVKLEKRYSLETAATLNLYDEKLLPYDLIIHLLETICFKDTTSESFSNAILIFMPGIGEIRRLTEMLGEHPSFGSYTAFRLYPLHSLLSSEEQSAVFEIPPEDIRKIVIATNIAETGITIPDITCVIDTGKHREMRFDEKRQLSRLVETFVAKSNAAQRRGRAGRVQNGLCYHLFTKIRHDTQMADNPLPEMMRLSLSDLALRIKILRLRMGTSIEDVLSRALDPPASINIHRAIAMLVEVGALTPSEDITPMGRLLSKLPTDVHLGKFLLIATLFCCLDPALTIAAVLNYKSPFISPFGLEQEADRAKLSFKVENSDFLTIVNAYDTWRRVSLNSDTNFVRKFCRLNYLSHQNLQQIEELRQQFLGYLIDSSFIRVDKSILRELSRRGGRRTRFVNVPSELNSNSSNLALVNAALVAGLYPKILSVDPSKNTITTITNNQKVSFHPSSVNFGRKPSEGGVNHMAYFTLMHSKKLYAWESGPVDDVAMLLLCGDCDFKLIADTVSIDRKIKFCIPPKSNIALKFLRAQLGSLLADQFRGQSLSNSRLVWNDVAMKVLGKLKQSDENDKKVSPSVVSS